VAARVPRPAYRDTTGSRRKKGRAGLVLRVPENPTRCPSHCYVLLCSPLQSSLLARKLRQFPFRVCHLSYSKYLATDAGWRPTILPKTWSRLTKDLWRDPRRFCSLCAVPFCASSCQNLKTIEETLSFATRTGLNLRTGAMTTPTISRAKPMIPRPNPAGVLVYVDWNAAANASWAS
jgi:hypothetical protein